MLGRLLIDCMLWCSLCSPGDWSRAAKASAGASEHTLGYKKSAVSSLIFTGLARDHLTDTLQRPPPCIQSKEGASGCPLYCPHLTCTHSHRQTRAACILPASLESCKPSVEQPQAPHDQVWLAVSRPSPFEGFRGTGQADDTQGQHLQSSSSGVNFADGLSPNRDALAGGWGRG